MRATLFIAAIAATLSACATGEDAPAADTAAVAAADPDRATGGTGIPAGFVAQADREGANLAEASYTAVSGGWEVRTGPAHILYAAADSASGTYTARTTFEQLEAPQHPEAFGLFIGGQNLDQASRRYTYFLTRGTGEYMVRVREGAETRTVADWTASNRVAKQDSSGRASYPMAIEVGADSVRFMVGGQAVRTVARSAVPTEGVAGIRINHNLHVQAQPVTIERR